MHLLLHPLHRFLLLVNHIAIVSLTVVQHFFSDYRRRYYVFAVALKLIQGRLGFQGILNWSVHLLHIPLRKGPRTSPPKPTLIHLLSQSRLQPIRQQMRLRNLQTHRLLRLPVTMRLGRRYFVDEIGGGLE